VLGPCGGKGCGRSVIDCVPGERSVPVAVGHRGRKQREHPPELDLAEHLRHVLEQRSLSTVRDVDMSAWTDLSMFSLDVGQSEAVHPGEGVAGGQSQHLRLAQERLTVEPIVIEWLEKDRHIGLAGAQQSRLLLPAGEDHLDRYGGVLGVVRREHVLEQPALHICLHREYEFAVLRAGQTAGSQDGGVERAQCRSCISEQPRARLGEADPASGAFEQPYPEFSLERGDRT